MTNTNQEKKEKYLAEHCTSDCRRDGCPHEEKWEEEFDNRFHSKIEMGGKCECEKIKKLIRTLLSQAQAEERQRCLEAWNKAEKHGTLPYPNPFGKWVSIKSHNRVIQEMRQIFMSDTEAISKLKGDTWESLGKGFTEHEPNYEP